MRKRKIAFIQQNRLTVDFWKQYIKGDTQLSMLDHHEKSLTRLSTINPDLIVIDNYWASSPLEDTISMVLACSHNCKIIVLTPNGEREQSLLHRCDRLHFSRFTRNFLNQLSNKTMRMHIASGHVLA